MEHACKGNAEDMGGNRVRGASDGSSGLTEELLIAGAAIFGVDTGRGDFADAPRLAPEW